MSGTDTSGPSRQVDYTHHSPRHQSPPEFAGDSLDLSATDRPAGAAPAPAATAAVTTAPAAARQLPVRAGPRLHGTEQVLLTAETPAVTLTRVQSGIGRLTITAVCAPGVGDLRLAALYQLRSGGTSAVTAAGNRLAPSSRRPVLVATRERYEQIAVDLRQVGDLERMTVVAFAQDRSPLTWGGTLVVATAGGGRVELPLESLYRGRTAVLASVLGLDGELVIRAEMEVVDGDVREAARAYGYDRITWLDDREPVV